MLERGNDLLYHGSRVSTPHDAYYPLSVSTRMISQGSATSHPTITTPSPWCIVHRYRCVFPSATSIAGALVLVYRCNRAEAGLTKASFHYWLHELFIENAIRGWSVGHDRDLRGLFRLFEKNTILFLLWSCLFKINYPSERKMIKFLTSYILCMHLY